MKLSFVTSVLAATLALSVAPLAQAQGGGGSSLTREQVKMERDAFLKLMRWDEMTSMWVLKSGMEPPAGVMSRAEVIAMRDKFLTMHRFDDNVGSWVALKAPREMSTLSREQVAMETTRFLMMYRYDEYTNEWVSKMKAGN